ncbi:exported hypothetical protein [Verrucomicrobia bacterium]|nr:exported hypothetical protein [Verrucomicrobiota bacterium]
MEVCASRKLGGHGGKMKRRAKIALAILVAALALVALLTATRQSAPGSGVGVAFVGYTNDAGGSRFALFEITDRERVSINLVDAMVEVEGMSATSPVFILSQARLSPKPLKSWGAKTIAIRVPWVGARWRLWIQFQRRTIPEHLRDYWMRHGRSVPVMLGRVTILGPLRYDSTNSAWLPAITSTARTPTPAY